VEQSQLLVAAEVVSSL